MASSYPLIISHQDRMFMKDAIGTLIRGSLGTEVCIGCIGSVATKGVSYFISFDLTKISVLSPIVV